MFSTYPETLKYLYDTLPIFQRVGSIAYKKDITNTVRLCEAIGNPHLRFKSIHVAGTNGKGSTSHMIASIMHTAGYKTGLYTSPHLKEFTERIRINGKEIPREYVVDFVNRIRPAIDEVQPSFFEVTVAMAFDYFAAEKVDVAVIEVGLGGRLDSTNIISPEVSVITNIGWDHTDLLGDTLAKIASEKAGIIKPGVPVVISERQSEIEDVFIARANECNSRISFASDEYNASSSANDGQNTFDISKNGVVIFRDLDIPLQGYYQKKNLIGVLKTVEILAGTGWNITPADIREGIANVIGKTGLKGRWQKLGERPLIICDTAHNLDGLREVVNQIRAQTFEKLHIVLGVVKEKDLRTVLEVLPKEAFYYFCEAKIPRALAAQELSDAARAANLNGVVIPDVSEAVSQAKQKASPGDMIFIGGSTFVVAELENL